MCVSGTELHHVNIGSTANSPNKVARLAAYTSCTVKGCNIVYTSLYTTAVNEVAHLPTKFTVGWILSDKSLVYKFFLVHLVYIHYTKVAGAT